MSSRKAARMMQPPFQIRASAARSTPQPCASDLALMMFIPCAYEQILDAYRAARTLPTSSALSTAEEEDADGCATPIFS